MIDHTTEERSRRPIPQTRSQSYVACLVDTHHDNNSNNNNKYNTNRRKQQQKGNQGNGGLSRNLRGMLVNNSHYQSVV
jgi:hypothetical protein